MARGDRGGIRRREERGWEQELTGRRRSRLVGSGTSLTARIDGEGPGCPRLKMTVMAALLASRGRVLGVRLYGVEAELVAYPEGRGEVGGSGERRRWRRLHSVVRERGQGERVRTRESERVSRGSRGVLRAMGRHAGRQEVAGAWPARGEHAPLPSGARMEMTGKSEWAGPLLGRGGAPGKRQVSVFLFPVFFFYF